MERTDIKKLLYQYIAAFNATDEENVVQAIPNAQAADWLESRIPLIAVPDPEIERTYYFRWWTYRKHIKKTPDGYVMSEFHPDVSWAGEYNTIPCAAGHHVREGRWLRDSAFLDDYIRFWYKDGGKHLRSYSNWLEAAVESLAVVRGDDTGLGLLDVFCENYAAWRTERRGKLGLYWSHDGRDGSEFSVSGPGLRATLNSYEYAAARALAAMAKRAGRNDLSAAFNRDADELKRDFERLWNEEKRFYITLPQTDPQSDPFISDRRSARELLGYAPWMFGLAQSGRGDAFRQLTDPESFKGAFGPTTCERRSEDFGLFYTGEALNRWLEARGEHKIGPNGHECLWNGPSWPFATSIMLTALANYLTEEPDAEQVSPQVYVDLLSQYAAAHVRRTEAGRVIPWIDENFDPDTGDWIARTRLMDWGGERFPASKGGYERGKDYNHSTFCDLVLEGLFGVRPTWEALEIAPLFPKDWAYAEVKGLFIHGKNVDISYEKGAGYRVFVDGKAAFESEIPARCRIAWG